MPSPLRSPKTLSQWFELDYFRRRRLFRGLWRPLNGVALLVSCLAVVWTLFAGERTIYQAGPLSTAHAIFNQDCGKCHVEAFPTWKRLWTGDASVRAVPDSACKQCHAGPPHHACAAERACASCHHEHRGQHALARVTDNQCTSCHADLKCDNGKPSDFAARVTGFAPGRHPEFRLWREGQPTDPGTLRFSHKVHLKELPVLDHKRNHGGEEVASTNRVRLECRSCHEMDEAGRYALPIRFDRHCKECHPQSVQLVGDWKSPLRERAEAFSAEPTLHPSRGETAQTVRAVLRDRLTRFILRVENKPFLGDAESPTLPRPLAGWPRAEPPPAREFAWVNRQLRSLEHVLFDGGGGCIHCHHEKTTPETRSDGLPVYQPPALLGVDKPWYEHSAFSHVSHQALQCIECHEGAPTSDRASDVLLPRIEKCRQCHNDSPQASARTDCVECHGYHDARLKRQFQGSLTIEQFLKK